MITPVVNSAQGVTLIGGGTVSRADVDRALTIAPCLVAADGGADRALAAGRVPEAVIGDLDSLSPAAASLLGAERTHLVAEQDSTDFEKCLARIAAPFVLALGFAGPRFDHMLAVWNALVRIPSPPCLVLGKSDLVFAVPAGRRLSLDLAAGTRVSLFPMASLRGNARGLVWSIDDLDFAPDGRIGTSNAAVGPVTIEFDKSGMLMILPRACLKCAIAALVPAR